MLNETYKQYVERVGLEYSLSEDLWNQVQADIRASQELVEQGGHAAEIAQDNIEFLSELLEIVEVAS